MMRFLLAAIATLVAFQCAYGQPTSGDKWTLQFKGAWTVFEPNDYTAEGEYLFMVPAQRVHLR